MKNQTRPIFFCLFLFLFTFHIQGQQWSNLDFSKRSPTLTAWKYLRVPSSSGPEKLPDGSRALYITGPFTESNSGAIHQTIPCQLEALKEYKVSVRIKTKDTKGRGASLYVYGKADDEVLTYAEGGNLNGTNDWQLISFTFIGDHRMDSIRLGCFLEGDGEAWFKDIEWEEVSKSNSPIAAKVEAYIDTFFQIVRSDVLYADQLDFDLLRLDLNTLIAGARETSETHDALNYILRRINNHSFLIPPANATKWTGTAEGEVSQDPQDIALTTGKRIDEQIAYLSVPAVGSGHAPTLTYFADSLQKLIKGLDNEKTTGWIVDLRNNGGGNCWPMLAGIGPLLGEGNCGYFMAPDGSNAQVWNYQKGSSYLDGVPQTTVSQTPYFPHNQPAKVAVLMGARTASSGEIMAIAFNGRPNSRSFGQATAGYSTTNQNYYLSDGAIMLLTVSVYADRNKQIIPLRLSPDVIISNNKDNDEDEDAVLSAAIKWLQQKEK